jgi:alkanesulfonate monooxygenase SsuD/methylene tetrahydromethanopterin reductase-like flavin-dependent oxidoreductase (luciferase family)
MGVSRQVYVSTTDARAREEAEDHFRCFFHEIAAPHQTVPELRTINAARATERSFSYKTEAHRAMPQGDDQSYEAVLRDGYCIVGSPDTVTRRIKEQQEALGVGVFLTYLPFGTMEPPQAMQSLELFAKEVMPNLR